MKNLFNAAAEDPQSGAQAGAAPAPSGGDGTDNPEYQKAMELAKSKLYEEGAGEKIAKALEVAPDLPIGLADQGKALLAAVDDATQGGVPDELYMMLGIELLGEVAEIADAAGMQVDGRVIAVAMQKFITGLIEDLGGDTTQVKQAMAQLDPNQVGGALDKLEA